MPTENVQVKVIFDPAEGELPIIQPPCSDTEKQLKALLGQMVWQARSFFVATGATATVSWELIRTAEKLLGTKECAGNSTDKSD